MKSLLISLLVLLLILVYLRSRKLNLKQEPITATTESSSDDEVHEEPQIADAWDMWDLARDTKDVVDSTREVLRAAHNVREPFRDPDTMNNEVEVTEKASDHNVRSYTVVTGISGEPSETAVREMVEAVRRHNGVVSVRAYDRRGVVVRKDPDVEWGMKDSCISLHSDILQDLRQYFGTNIQGRIDVWPASAGQF